MKTHDIRWFVAVVSPIAIAFSGCHAPGPGPFENPVIRDDWPDPTIADGGDGWYYSLATKLQTVRRSADLVHWEDMRADPLEPSARRTLTDLTANLWAPSLVRVGSRWLLYVSLFVADDDNRIEVLTADRPSGPFAYIGNVVSSRRIGIPNSIDPFVLEADGRIWMFFGSAQDGVHRIELAKDGLAPLPGAQPVHVAGLRKIRDRDVSMYGLPGAYEGSYVMKRGEWWYLFLSGGRFYDGSYHLVVGRSKSVDGSFVDRNGVPLAGGVAEPILRSVPGDRFIGPGHNGDVFRSADGRYWMPYHAHDVMVDDKNERRMLLQELKWTDDGWPYFQDGRPAHFNGEE